MSLQQTFTNMSMDSYGARSVQTVKSQLERITDLCLRLNGEELALATEFIALLVRRQR